MVHKVTWSSLAVQTYIGNIEYLEKEWSRKEVSSFINAVQRKLIALSVQPQTGTLTNRRKNIRRTVLNKRVVLIYRYKPSGKEIELIRFHNTYMKI